MDYRSTFKRYELKYIITQDQRARLMKLMDGRMVADEYGHSTVRNIYYDTDDFRIIRHSLDHPPYKEKLRLRSYQCAAEDDDVFVELKKKYKGVVYKRRLVLPQRDVKNCFDAFATLPNDSQIAREIDYFRRLYHPLQPKVFLSYQREAYFALGGSDFRMTFDTEILYRTSDLTLGSAINGTPLLNRGESLLEIKTAGGMPMWLSKFLAQEGIYKTTFSKYGAAYRSMIGS